MKKILVTILAFLYLATSTGATVHLHYCMGKLVDFGLMENTGDQCGSCGMKKIANAKKSCCRDEHQQVKLTADQKTAESSIQMMQAVVADLPIAFQEITVMHPLMTFKPVMTAHAPPESASTAVCIRNCCFLI